MFARALFLALTITLALAGPPPEALPLGRTFFRAYGDRQGLQTPTIPCLAEDAHGYLYVGSNNGLYRCDGAHFERILLPGQDAGVSITALAPHPVDGIWAGTPAGLAFIMGTHVRWAKLAGEPQQPPIGIVCLDAGGRAWVIGPKGLYRQGRGDTFQLDPDSARWGLQRLAHGPGPVVAAGDHDLMERDEAGRWIRRTTEGPRLLGVAALVADVHGGLWAVEGKQVWHLPKGATTWNRKPFELPETLLEDAQPKPRPEGGIALLTLQRLVLVDETGLQTIDPANGLPEEELLAVHESRQGALWMGGSGLYRRLGTGRFRVFTEREGLPDRRVWAIHRRLRTGQLIVGTHRGAAVLEGSRFLPVPGLEGRNIQRITEDPQGGLWFITTAPGIYHLPPGATRAQHLLSTSERVATLLPDGKGGGDFLFERGGIRHCPSLKLPLRFTPDVLKPVAPPGTLLWGMRRDAAGRLLLTSDTGLHVHVDGRWISFGKQDGLAADRLNGIRVARDGTYWLTYAEPHGATHVRLEGTRLQILQRCGEATSLPTNAVYDALPRPGDGAWILTGSGLIAWSPQQYRLYTTEDGIGSNDCNEGAILEEPDGGLWFGTTRGLVHGRLPATPDPPPAARITSQTTPQGRRLFPHVPPLEELPFRQGEVTFTFATKAMAEADTVRYQVHLSGHDSDWYDSPEPTAHYSSLREGAYQFRVRARRPGEPWGPVAGVAFRILPPWYRSWWGWTLWGSLGVLAVWGISQLRTRALTAQRNRLNQEVQERTREIQEAREALEVANEALQAQTVTDPLTHLKNRRFLDLTLPADLARASLPSTGSQERRSPRDHQDLIFLIVDLDRFKVINDTHGHRTGDEVLRQTAGVLRAAMRETDALVRWGGEEFLLLARQADRREGGQIAERIRTLVATHPFDVGFRNPLHVTCSVGFAPFPLEGASAPLTWERVVDLADQCLYLVKRSGRNGWMGLLDGRMTAPQAGNLRGLREASERGDVELLTSLEVIAWDET